MHGQPRKALKQEDEAALSAKAEKLRSLQAQFLANHHNHMLLFLPSNFSLSLVSSFDLFQLRKSGWLQL